MAAQGDFDFSEQTERTRRIVGVLLLVAYWAVVIPSTVLFLLRRHLHPISKRFPVQAALLQFYLGITVTNMNVRYKVLSCVPFFLSRPTAEPTPFLQPRRRLINIRGFQCLAVS
jgi:hypothetical protein